MALGYVPKREKYFMNQEQEDAAATRLRQRLHKAEKHLVLLRNEGRELGELLVDLGQKIQGNEAWNISVECYKSVVSDETLNKIVKLKQEIPDSEAEVTRLKAECELLD